MDDTDLRYANQTTLRGKELDYGITLNNNPTVEDLWNRVPAWGHRFSSSSANVSPIAVPIITRLGPDVAGIGG